MDAALVRKSGAVVTRERAIIIIILKIGVVIIVRIGRSKKLENPFPLLLDRFFFAAPHCLRNDSRPPVDRNTPHALPIFSTNYCSEESFSPLLCRPIGARSMRKKIITRLESVCADGSASQITIAGFKRWRWAWKIQEHNAANRFGGNGSSENCVANSTSFQRG